MRYTHGATGTRLYSIWKSMKCRCLNKNHPTFKYYGKRGITICADWIDDFSKFQEWALSHGYSEDLELDRINVNSDYSPDNCRWISHYQQTMNRRDTLFIKTGNQTEKIRDFCKRMGISINTINNWRHLGVLEEKLSARLGCAVMILGGR